MDEKYGFRFIFDYDGSKRVIVELDKDANIGQFFEACETFAAAVGYSKESIEKAFGRD